MFVMNTYTFDCLAPNGIIVTRIEVKASSYWSAKRKLELYHPGYDNYILTDRPSLFQLIHC
jgi:hypothetical protein